MDAMARTCFGRFSFNSDTGELLRDGIQVHLPAQPAKVLALLVSARGELVTREALRDAIWNDGTSVDFDRGLNFAIAQVRTALGDSADSPTFVRTVPKRGYQFIAPIAEPKAHVETSGDAALAVAPIARPQFSRRWMVSWFAGAGAAASVAALAVVAIRGSRSREARIAVARFQNETGNPTLDRLADTITDSVVAGLTAQTAGRYGIIGNAAILRQPRGFQNLDEIASALEVQYVIIGQVQKEGPGVRVLAHLIRLPEKTHLGVSRAVVDEPASESALANHIVADFTRKLSSLPAVSN
jgi:DNA-binding winged helix-turn-helix (wHTH) protein/TolB-like protein